jgi:hypothetical protein
VSTSIAGRLSALLDGGVMERRLERFAAAGKRVLVAAACAGVERFLGTAASLARPDALIAPGCLTKLITAGLLASELPDLSLDVGAVLAACEPALAGVTLLHLLEHTHGLDDSLLHAAPLDAHGRIDVGELAGALGVVPRLAVPGAVYSYSNAGAWLAAAVLEHRYGCRYADLLGSALALRRLPQAQLCAALGRRFTLPVGALLSFLQVTASSWPCSSPWRQLPGWNLSNEASAVAGRCTERACSVTNPSCPAPRRSHGSCRRAAQHWSSTASTCRRRQSRRGCSQRCRSSSACSRYRRGVMCHPAGGGLLVGVPTDDVPLGFVQIVDADDDRCRFLWDGRTVLRRV